MAKEIRPLCLHRGRHPPQPAQPWSTPVPAPRSNAYDLAGNLTAFGELFAAWDNNDTVVADTRYYVHNKGTRKRMANLTTQSNLAGRSIRVTGDFVQWTLVASPTSGQYYLVSALDGRRLSTDGTTVSLVSANTTGTAVQWRLTEKQYGWFYVENPASTKRLQLAYNNSTSVATYTMAANTTTTDAVQWRFIIPLSTPTWSGAGGASWATAGNWASNQPPTSFDSVIFDASATANLSTTLGKDFDILGLILTANTGPVSIGGTHTLTLGGGGIDLSGSAHNLTISAPLVFGANQTWTVASGLTLSVNGGASGNASLNIAGSGKVSLGGAATHTGDTTIASGSTLQLGAANVLPNGNGFGNVVVNGTLDLNGFAETINGLSGTGRVDNTGASNSVFTLGGNDVAISVGGIFQNTGAGSLALVKIGGGSLTLTGANTHGGGFTNHGTGDIQPKNNASFGGGPVVMNAGTLYTTGASYTFNNPLTLNGANLRVGGSSRSLTWTQPVNITADSGLYADGGSLGITLSAGLNLNDGGYTLTSSANGTANTLSAPITGANGTIQVTLGTLNLNAANTFGGTFRSVAGGPLKIGDANSLQNAMLDLNAADSGSVNLNNLNATIGALTGARNLALGSGAVSIGNNNLSTTYGGVLSGTGSLTKIGTGTLTLSGANSYSGGTTINGGTLALGSSNVLPGNMTIGTATLDAATFTESLGTLRVTGAARIRLSTGAALAFASSNAVDWSGGTLTITGTFVSGASIRFGTTSGGLTSTQLARISATGYGAFGLNSSGYLTASPPSGYASWAATNAPGGTAQDDFDGDGVGNGIEYVLGGDKNTNDVSKLPQVSINGGNFVFSFQRSQASIDGTTAVTIEVGTTLAAWPDSYPVSASATANNPGVSVIKNSAAGFDTVTLSVPLAPDTRKFARLKMTP